MKSIIDESGAGVSARRVVGASGTGCPFAILLLAGREPFEVIDMGGEGEAGAAKRQYWTKAREAAFFAELGASANVTRSAAAASMSVRAAHLRRQRNPAFAAAWLAALDQGYAELEALLLRQAMDGTERIETVVDEAGQVKQTKTVRSFPHGVAMRLFLCHRDAVERYRIMMAAGAEDDPALAAKVRAEMARVRERLQSAEDGPDAGG